MNRVFKNKGFLIGFLFLSGLLITSFIYSSILKEIIPNPPESIYSEDHLLIDVPPYPPSWKHPFGVDRQGEDVFWKVIDGAKFTVFAAVFISMIQIVFSLAGGLFYAFYLRKYTFIIESIVRAFRFTPMILVALLFFTTIPTDKGASGVFSILLQLFILAVVAVPPLISLIGQEVAVCLKNEFINCSRVIGANNFWLMKKHVMSHMKPRLFLYFTQQIIQALILLVHLGTFNILLGGAKIVGKFSGLEQVGSVALSLTNEWSGLIGLSYRELMLDPWIVLGPSMGFVLTIFSFKLIGKGIEKTLVNRNITMIPPKQMIQPKHIPRENINNEFEFLKTVKSLN
jgi:peptide/nickel transport system permease protein